MEIAIKNLQKTIPLRPAQIRKTAKKALDFLRIKDAGLSLVFTTDSKIRFLNKKYLKKDHATDVLAFDLRWDGPFAGKRLSKNKPLSGEIVISTQTVVRNARLYGVPAAQELVLCVVHGILHLIGYDDHTSRDIQRMRRREQEVLKAVFR